MRLSFLCLLYELRKMKKKKLLLNEGGKTAECVAAVLFYALGVNLLAVPSGVYCGGLFGLCQLLRTVLVEYCGLSIRFDIASVIYYVLNVPILIYAWFKISRRFLVKTLITLSFMTVFLALIPTQGLLPNDRLASCVVSGIICGASTGIILRMGSSAGGFDIIGLLLIMRRKDMSVGKVSLLVNALLFLLCGFMFDIQVVIYSMIYTAVYSFTVDKVHYQNIAVEAKIITKKTGAIEQDIMTQLQRGTTKWNCIGSYTGTESHVLCVLLSKYELPQLRLIVRRYDPEAFIVLNENVHVQGNFLKRL